MRIDFDEKKEETTTRPSPNNKTDPRYVSDPAFVLKRSYFYIFIGEKAHARNETLDKIIYFHKRKHL